MGLKLFGGCGVVGWLLRGFGVCRRGNNACIGLCRLCFIVKYIQCLHIYLCGAETSCGARSTTPSVALAPHSPVTYLFQRDWGTKQCGYFCLPCAGMRCMMARRMCGAGVCCS